MGIGWTGSRNADLLHRAWKQGAPQYGISGSHSLTLYNDTDICVPSFYFFLTIKKYDIWLLFHLFYTVTWMCSDGKQSPSYDRDCVCVHIPLVVLFKAPVSRWQRDPAWLPSVEHVTREQTVLKPAKEKSQNYYHYEWSCGLGIRNNVSRYVYFYNTMVIQYSCSKMNRSFCFSDSPV